MWNTARRKAAFAGSALSVPRFRLGPVPSHRTLLGGRAASLNRVPEILATLTSTAQPNETALSAWGSQGRSARGPRGWI